MHKNLYINCYGWGKRYNYGTEIENLVNGLEQAMDLVGNGNDGADNETMKLDGPVTLNARRSFCEEMMISKLLRMGKWRTQSRLKTDVDTRVVTEGDEELGGNGTSKMRLVQAVLSPRKNGSTKSGKHQGGGEGAKQTEEKGPLNPKNSSAKPLN
ncbi:LOW QUALITY PROTEIN: hypothetical protein HID58_018384 [Brassica napus]|uniref:Uncharacterized protein n=1 Tax=Brassica napus TaxID=3708 RepID=A0ABQ8D9T8_BRANA|nr:LOW QUALITY PROTEIN: hypothetical protein HID58_018384 [Brassica napus]